MLHDKWLFCYKNVWLWIRTIHMSKTLTEADKQ